eukprot:gene1545-65908_t
MPRRRGSAAVLPITAPPFRVAFAVAVAVAAGGRVGGEVRV